MVTVNETNREPDGTFEALEAERIINKSYRDRPQYTQSGGGTVSKTLSDIQKIEATFDGNVSGTNQTVWILTGIPRCINRSFRVNINSDYPDKHIYVPPTWLIGGRGDRVEGGGVLEISGDRTTPKQIKSFTAVGTKGYHGRINGVDIQSNDPFTDEGAGVFLRGADEWSVADVKFSAGRYGILSYSTNNVMVNSVDFGGSVLTKSGLLTKHNGQILEQRAATTPTSGNVQGVAYRPSSGIINARATSSLTGDNGTVTADDGFLILNDESNGKSEIFFRETKVGTKDLPTRESKTIGNWYQNTGLGEIDVTVVVTVDTTDGSLAEAVLDINESQSNNYLDKEIIDSPSSTTTFSLSGSVQPGEYYKIRDNSFSGTSLKVDRWSERR